MRLRTLVRALAGIFLRLQEVGGSSRTSSSPNDPLRELRLPTPDVINKYSLWQPDEIVSTIVAWADRYPHFVRVTTAQEAYGVPAINGKCPGFPSGPCETYIVVLQDFVTHPEGSDASSRLPEVLWTAAINGEDRIGPSALMEAAELLLTAGECQAYPRPSVRSDTYQWQGDLRSAFGCRRRFEQLGIETQWLARLLTTRRIVLVPVANPLGFTQSVTEEADYNPTQDFGYYSGTKQCMQTLTARALNELARDHLFQMALIFDHTGNESIGYPWGWGKPAPDHVALSSVASALSRYGGGWMGSEPYAVGSIGDVTLPVGGRIEDWLYGGSWNLPSHCQPSTYDGYPVNKTIYNNSTLRAASLMISSSRDRTPSIDLLGTTQELLTYGTVGTGYISRAIRLALLSADLVEPYIAMRAVNEMVFTDDLVPMAPRVGRYCPANKAASVPANSRKVSFQWEVGGAMAIAETRVWYAEWRDLPRDFDFCKHQPTIDMVSQYMTVGTPIGATSGTGKYSPERHATLFAASIDISDTFGYQPGDRLAVLVSARVDQSWATRADNDTFPDVLPQSHLAHARTDPSWYHRDAGKLVEGRNHWFSLPLTIVLHNATDDEPAVETVELSFRFDMPEEGKDDDGDSQYDPSHDPLRPTYPNRRQSRGFSSLAATLLLVAIAFGVYLGMRSRRLSSHPLLARRYDRLAVEGDGLFAPIARLFGSSNRFYAELSRSDEVELGAYQHLNENELL